jgi:hypothetical protein
MCIGSILGEAVQKISRGFRFLGQGGRGADTFYMVAIFFSGGEGGQIHCFQGGGGPGGGVNSSKTTFLMDNFLSQGAGPGGGGYPLPFAHVCLGSHITTALHGGRFTIIIEDSRSFGLYSSVSTFEAARKQL